MNLSEFKSAIISAERGSLTDLGKVLRIVGGKALPRDYTYATLPAANSVPDGTQAYTSDVGPVYSDGVSWVPKGATEEIWIPRGDNAAARINAAYTALTAAGGGTVRLMPGSYTLEAAVTPTDKVAIRGAGMGVTILNKASGSVAFNRGPGSAATGYIHISDLTIQGDWLSNQTLGDDNDRHIKIYNCDLLAIERVESVYCRQMGITAVTCGNVDVTHCRVRYCARDAINITGCRRVRATNNRVAGCSDDAIAIHQTVTAGNPPCEGHVIAGNIIEDSYGIKCLGLSKAAISGNTLRRVKGYGIFAWTDGSEGLNDIVALAITGNTITDVINGTFWGGGSNNYAIVVGSSAKSYQEPVVGGATPDINYPEDFYYVSNHATNQNAGLQGVVISGNTIIGFTLPATAQYTSWGYGQSFRNNGFVDPDLSAGFEFGSIGILLSGPILSTHISGNYIGAVSSLVQLNSVSSSRLKLLKFDGNTCVRWKNHGISLETSSQKYGFVDITNNTFDGDPYFESANRTTPIDGTWSSGAQTPTIVDAVNFTGVRVAGNSFRNVNQISHTSGANPIEYSGNSYRYEPASADVIGTSSNNGNKGIRSHSGMQDMQARVMWEDSTPTSATYGQVLGVQIGGATAMPTSGYFVTGQFVFNLGVATATQTLEAGTTDPTPQYTLIGWKRLTTGNAHVLNTDWRELRCLTGN